MRKDSATIVTVFLKALLNHAQDLIWESTGSSFWESSKDLDIEKWLRKLVYCDNYLSIYV
jgi:hypothetical protein